MTVKMKQSLAIAGLAATVAARIILSIIPQGRFWGLNQLAYFPVEYSIAATGVLLAAVAGCFNRRVVAWFESFYNRLRNSLSRIRAVPRMAIYIGISLAIFLILRDSTNLLGDGLLRIGELQNKRLENFISQHSAEPLDYLIHYFVYSVILAPLKLKPIFCYQLLSAMSGALYIYASYYLAKKLNGGKQSGFAFWYLLGWGGVMLFFGYVESYALAAASLMILFSYSFEIIYNRGNDLVLAGLFLLAFFIHNTAIVFLPAIVYLFLAKSGKPKIRNIAVAGILAAIVIAWSALGVLNRKTAGLLLSGSFSEPGYTLFSLAHFGDIVNELLLTSPALAGLIWLQKWRGNGDFKVKRYFFRLAAFGSVAFLFFADPVLGMGRDWDLFSLPLIGVHVWLLSGVEWNRIDSRIKAAILVIILFSTGSWIWTNHNPAPSIERYENLAGLDSARSRYAYERLGTYLLLYKNWQKAEEVYQLSLRKEPHYRTYLGLAYVQAKMGKGDLAKSNYEKALELNPDQALAIYSLCETYIDEGNPVRARELFERLKRVSTTGIVSITARAIRDLESKLIEAERAAGDSADTAGIR